MQALLKERGHLSFDELEPIFTQLCFGLSHAHHQKVVHRDIKPANIMIVDGMSLKDEGSVKILDFGIAKIVSEDRGEMDALTQTGEIFGSPFYMSPEQCAGESIDQRSDIYSVGCVLFESMTGTPPLVGANPLRTMMLHVNEKAPSLKEATLGAQFPPLIEQIVAKMLSKSPGDRYSDLGIVAIELHRACNRLSASTPVSPENADANLKTKGRKSIAFAPAQLAVLLVFVSALSVFSTVSISHYLKDRANEAAAALQKNVNIRNEWLGEKNIKDTGARHRREKIEEYRRSFEKVSRITAVPVVEDGIRKRRIVFPDLRCGATRDGASDLDGTRGIDKSAARGQRVYSDTGPIIFNVNENIDEFALSNYFIYDKIDPNIFSGLDLEALPFANRQVIVADSDLADVRPGVLHLFKVIQSWNNLQFVNFRDVDVGSELILPLNKCKRLTYLVLHTPKYDPDFVSRQPFFKQLDSLIAVYGDVSPMLKCLSHKHDIKKLSVGDHAMFSAAAAASLQACTHIDFFSLSQLRYEDPTARALANLNNVSRISFTRGALTPHQESMFERRWRMLGRNENRYYDNVEDFVRR